MKTKQVFLGICLLLCSTLFVSCEKEPITDIGVIEKNLKEIVEANNISKCSIYLLYGEQDYTEHQNADFKIEDGFVIVDRDRYNLLYLSKYVLTSWDGYKENDYIIFYFANTIF